MSLNVVGIFICMKRSLGLLQSQRFGNSLLVFGYERLRENDRMTHQNSVSVT